MDTASLAEQYVALIGDYADAVSKGDQKSKRKAAVAQKAILYLAVARGSYSTAVFMQTVASLVDRDVIGISLVTICNRIKEMLDIQD